ncbi:hypothetical protein [Enteractinococcus coprophilus]|uniref:Uncharacterized protein n=1 Tax=Enteractinococcus coprophilus TaxID=1027633 RepID=A0A543ANR8_9MICC|nr:hypothetical protein [Enteractinococcus coprophilus]TQL74186.1 hypothetical protein FB556_0639 [Enteractinococcus coprophilus]
MSGRIPDRYVRLPPVDGISPARWDHVGDTGVSRALGIICRERRRKSHGTVTLGGPTRTRVRAGRARIVWSTRPARAATTGMMKVSG